MLLTLKDDNTAGSFCQHHVFYMLSMIIMSVSICTIVNLYTILMYTHGAIVDTSLFAVGCYMFIVSLAEYLTLICI